MKGTCNGPTLSAHGASTRAFGAAQHEENGKVCSQLNLTLSRTEGPSRRASSRYINRVANILKSGAR
jgi:hypothetical protein